MTVTTPPPTDRELVREFAATRDEAAFAEIVRRHGPMVLAVCRRVLADAPDADDAFQAVFLVLARRAGSVGRPERLAGWLYGVALRGARRARAAAGGSPGWPWGAPGGPGRRPGPGAPGRRRWPRCRTGPSSPPTGTGQTSGR